MSIYSMRTWFRSSMAEKLLMGILAGIFIIGAVNYFGAAPGSKRDQNAGSKAVLAKVNGIPITQDEFDVQWSQMKENASHMGVSSTTQLADMRAQIFARLVQSRLLLSAAQKMGVSVSERDIDNALDAKVVERLKENRKMVLGQVSREQEKLDPRNDSDYKNELTKNGMSLAQQEEMAKAMFPRTMIQAELAAQGIQNAIKAKVGKISDKDVEDSYNIYKIREITLIKGKLPEAQLQNKAKGIQKEASSGGDFAKLARDNSDDPMKSNGGAFSMTFESQQMFPPEFVAAVLKLKPGQVSKVIDTDRGIYIARLESVEKKLPAKFDNKTKRARRKQVEQMREYPELANIQKMMTAQPGVSANNAEMRGYWHMMQAQQSMMDQGKYRKEMNLAMASFDKAYTQDPSNDYAAVKLVQLWKENGKTKEAKELLANLLMGKNSAVEGADLRVMLGDMLLADGKPDSKDQALKQYQKASEIAVNDRSIHEQLQAKFKSLGRADLAANEAKMIANYDQRMKEMQAQQQKAMEEQTKRASKNAPKSPKTEPGKAGG